jgi:phosphohistidine phosphatase
MTTRTLILLRHAKAERPDGKPDFERRLTKRGQADAEAAGSWLADQGLLPDLVLSSPATRTRQTWHGIAVGLAQTDPDGKTAPEVRYEHDLYDGGRTEIIDLLRAVPDDMATILVIGHNPPISDVSILLRGDAGGLEGLKTCGIAVHRADGPWSETEPGGMELVAEHTARG